MNNDLLDTNDLFEERTPEAAAWQLALVLAWATECQLATLEDLKGIYIHDSRRI